MQTKENRKNNITVIMGRKGSGKTELSGYLARHHEKTDKMIVWDTLAQFEYPNIADHTIKVEKWLSHSAFKIAVRLPEYYFPYICKMVRQKEDCCYLVDEVDMFCTASKMDNELDQLVRYGRHYGIDLIFTARRPPEVHRHITANADDIYIFQTHEPRDLVYLSKFMDTDQIRSLEQYECLHYNTLEQKYTKEYLDLNEDQLLIF